MFLGFFTFFGSIVLLPLYLQTLMGYTAFLAGVVLGPGGILTLVMLPLAGKLTQRFDARYLLGFGLLFNAYSVWYMSGFNLNIDLAIAITGRVIQGIGMPFFFVTIAYVTMAYVPNPQMNNASAIFNLLRNLGGSFGVAFITTMLSRRAQFHQARLVEHLTPYDPSLQIWLNNIKEALAHQLGSLGDQTHRAMAVIYGQLQRQAATMAFDDVFHAQMIIFLALIGILWIMRKPPIGKKASPGGH
jgi:DHA2 family multidrug resistance protein